jgi:hypothetical protein
MPEEKPENLTAQILKEKFTEIPSFDELLKATHRPGSNEENVVTQVTNPLLGEIVDTHHPDFKGYVYVRWLSDQGETRQRWLAVVQGLAPRKGDRVLLQKPGNWPEMLVTAIVDPYSKNESNEEGELATSRRTLELELEEKIRITAANGRPLIEISATAQGPIIQVLSKDVNIEAPGKLSLRAETLELEGGRGGVDIQTEADTIVRARYIRLN